LDFDLWTKEFGFFHWNRVRVLKEGSLR
jgi:hypothetical protein